MYSIKRIAALWCAVMPSGVVVFKSLSKARVQDFIVANSEEGMK